MTAANAPNRSWPRVASRVGGIPEIVVEGETGYLVDYDRGQTGAFTSTRPASMS